MAKRIAFLSRLPALEIFSKTFGINYLSQNGFEVIFLDVSYLIDGMKGQNLYPDQAPLSNCETIVFRRLVELDRFVKESASSTIFVDFVGALFEFNLTVGRLYKIFKKYNVKYYIISNADIPTFNYNAHNFTVKILLKIKTIMKKPSLLIEFFTRKLILIAIKLNIVYQKPHRIFGMMDSPVVIDCVKRYGMSFSAVTPINSRDYDTYLEYMRGTTQRVISTETCVFLDEGIINHPDFPLFDITPVNEEEYISSMNHFFDHVEEKTGLAVVIAGHPKTSFSSENHPFGERSFTHGNTVQLVAKSKIVIAHASSAISFPVLFGKPIVLVTTSEINSRTVMVTPINAFSEALGLTPINVDTVDAVNSFETNIGGQFDYEGYLHKYVKNRVPLNKITWEIVADAVFEDLEC